MTEGEVEDSEEIRVFQLLSALHILKSKWLVNNLGSHNVRTH